MFLGSYAPLATIYFMLYVGKEDLVAIVALLAVILGVAGMWWILHTSKTNTNSVSRIVVDYRREGSEVMGYVAAYLIPFVGFTLSSLRQDVAVIIFFVVLAYLYVSTDMLHVNPMLQLLR